MPSWNRFDVCEAWYAYASENHSGQGSRAYAIFGRLDRMRFRPGLGVRERGRDALTDNGKAIYDSLRRRGY